MKSKHNVLDFQQRDGLNLLLSRHIGTMFVGPNRGDHVDMNQQQKYPLI